MVRTGSYMVPAR